jgi:hypothetical protein
MGPHASFNGLIPCSSVGKYIRTIFHKTHVPPIIQTFVWELVLVVVMHNEQGNNNWESHGWFRSYVSTLLKPCAHTIILVGWGAREKRTRYRRGTRGSLHFLEQWQKDWKLLILWTDSQSTTINSNCPHLRPKLTRAMPPTWFVQFGCASSG